MLRFSHSLPTPPLPSTACRRDDLMSPVVLPQKWKIMACKMKIEQLKEAVAWGNEEVCSGTFPVYEVLLMSQCFIR